jgi:mRNA-degrading endonuclease RelE of RelBE toxin-antitoxin system
MRIDVLAENPLSGKPLQAEYEGLYSLRVWPYRIIYKILKQKLIIEVIEIKHRQGAYKQ